MKQKFHIKHISSWSPLVQKLVQHCANFTMDNETFPIKGLFAIYYSYTSRMPKGIYEYTLVREGDSYILHEDGELVLYIELVEIHQLVNEPNY